MKKISSTRTFNLTRINQFWHFFWNFLKSKKCRRKKFSKVSKSKNGENWQFFTKNLLFFTEHLENTFNNLFRNTFSKKKQMFLGCENRKVQKSQKDRKTKAFPRKIFFHEIVPLDTQSTLPTPLTIIFLRMSQIPNQNPQLTRKVRFMKKNFAERLSPNRRMQFCHPSR